MSTRNVLIICCTVLLVGVLFWPTLYRYDQTTVNGNIVPIRINRLTGNTDWFIVGKWKPVSNPSRKVKGEKIPSKDLSKIIVRGDFRYSSFGGTIYNGTDWIITSITFKYAPKKLDLDLSDLDNESPNQVSTKPKQQQHIDLSEFAEETEEERNYSVDVTIMPLTVSTFSINVIEQKSVFSEWKVDEATGYKE